MRIIEPELFSPYEKDFLGSEMLCDYAFSLCGGPCAGLFRISGEKMLQDLVQSCIAGKIPFRVFGGMTNVLVSDDGFDGVILINRKGEIRHTEDGQGNVELTADSGLGMSAVVHYCAENSISGFEWASGLPGTAGGAVYGNAGAFGSDISECFISGTAVDSCGNLIRISNAEMEFGYRSGVLKRGALDAVLLSASFRLKKGSRADILAKGMACKEKRKASQPVTEHSLGSVFKNPEGDSAGRLIQAAGLKGYKIGKAAVSLKHANFITTEKGVTGDDYYCLVKHVQRTVFEASGIMLEPEIEFLGFASE